MAEKKNYELEIMISGAADSSLAASIRKARKEIDKLERQALQSGWNIKKSFQGIDAMGAMSDKFFGGVLKGAKMAAGGTAALLGSSAVIGSGFEAQMSTVQAISQASEEDMKRLNALAKEMGETTKFSAEEAGQGLEYMAMAGWKTADMINGLPGIMYLAAASGEELGLVSDIVTDAMTAFGMQASESARFADVLAQASASSNTNVAMMGETFQYVAPVAGAFGYSIEDVAIATGLMANAGIKGQKAGTAMRAMLTNLAKPTKQIQGYMDALKISLVDGAGNMKPFRQQLNELRSAFAGLTEAEKAEYAAGIAGKEGMSGLLAIVTASQSDFSKLADAIDSSTGAAQKMSEVRIDNLSGDLTLLKSAAEGAAIEMYEGMSQGLRGMTQSATLGVTWFTETVRENMPTIQRVAKSAGASIQEFSQPVIDFGGWCLKNGDIVLGTLAGISGAMATFKGVSMAKTGIQMLGKLSGMVGAWPVAAFGLAAGAITGIVTAVKANNNRLKKEDMARRFGGISLSMEELDETARAIVKSNNLKKVTESIESMGKIKTMADDFESASSSLNRLNWKIGMKIGLNESDQEDYAAAIDDMIRGSIDIVPQSQYTAQVSVQALFGTGSATGDALIADFNDMYATINGEVQALGKQLGDAYSAALEDGIIDIDESRTIQELQQKLASLTEQVSQSQFDAKMQRIGAQYSGKDLDAETFKNLQAEIQEVTEERKAGIEQAAEASFASLNLQHQRGEIGTEEYLTKRKSIGDKMNEQTMLADLSAVSWSAKSITDAYQDVFDQALPEVWANFEQSMNDSFLTAANGNLVLALDPEVMKQTLGLKEIDRAARDGIQELWEGTQEQYEQLKAEAQWYREAGKEIPQAIADGLRDAEMIGMLAGDTGAIWSLMGQSIAEDPKFLEVLKSAQDSGAQIPEEIAAYIGNNASNATDAVNLLGDQVHAEMERRFRNMSINGNIDFSFQANVSASSGSEKKKSGDVAHYARGGLISRPTLSWFAEDSPEMAIPLNGSQRSEQLWQETGRLLGVYEENRYDRAAEVLNSSGEDRDHQTAWETGTGSSAPVFNLTIQMTGDGGVKEQIIDGANAAFEQFAIFMERWKREQMRTAF